MMRLTTTVGFEFEFSGSSLASVERALRDKNVSCTRPGAWHRSDGSIWDLKTDSSCGWEVASPVLQTYEELVDAAHVGALISQAGGSVNHSCGFHVHIGVSNLSHAQLENVFRFLTRYETAFFLIVPPARRHSTWCKRLGTDVINRMKRPSFGQTDWWSRTWHDKNVWLNGRRYPDIRTIEFRIMPGTLNPNFIIGYVTFLQCMINNIKDRKICWGTVKSKDDRSTFQTMLGQAGFYGPWTTPEHKELCVTGRKWAIERYNLANTEQLRLGLTSETVPLAYRVSQLEPRIPSVSHLPSWAQQQQAPSPRVRRPRRVRTVEPAPAAPSLPDPIRTEASSTAVTPAYGPSVYQSNSTATTVDWVTVLSNASNNVTSAYFSIDTTMPNT